MGDVHSSPYCGFRKERRVGGQDTEGETTLGTDNEEKEEKAE